MAADYDARAKAAGETAPPVMEDVAGPDAEGEDMPEAGPGVALSIKPVRSRKETVIVERRPVGRPRRE